MIYLDIPGDTCFCAVTYMSPGILKNVPERVV